MTTSSIPKDSIEKLPPPRLAYRYTSSKLNTDRRGKVLKGKNYTKQKSKIILFQISLTFDL